MRIRFLRSVGLIGVFLYGCGGGAAINNASTPASAAPSASTPSTSPPTTSPSTGGVTPASTPGIPAPGVMYADGAFDSAHWPNDYSWNTVSVDNKLDRTHPQPGHTYDFEFYSPNDGGWQPATDWANNGLDLSAYTYMQFDVYPAAGAVIDWHWVYIGKIVAGQGNQDRATSAYVPDISYFGTLTPNAWNTIKLPMAAVGDLLDHNVYKFSLRDNRSASQPLFFDNVKWVAGNVSFAYGGDTAPASGWADASVNATVDYTVDPTAMSSSFVSLNGMIGTTGVSRRVAKLSASAAGGTLRLNNAGGFALAGLDHFTFGAYPTSIPQSYVVQFYDVNGSPVGNAVNPASYTPADMGAGAFLWTVYCIPLSAFGSLPSTIGGVSIKDASGNGTNTIYLSAIGFYS